MMKTLTKDTERPVPWYWVAVDGRTIGFVVKSDGQRWRAYLVREGRQNLGFGDYPTRCKAVAVVIEEAAA